MGALIDVENTTPKGPKLEDIQQRLERSYIKLTLGLLGGALLFGVVCWAGWHFYVDWESRHLVRRAVAYLGGGDAKSASLSARRAFQLNAHSAAAARVLAEAAQAAGDRSAVDWRRKVTELDPNSIEDALALAQCALQFGDTITAERTLSGLPSAAQQRADYQAAAARLAESKKNQPDAVAHWKKATELAPNDKPYVLELAAARLASKDPTEQRVGREAMRGLRHDGKLGPAATRALIIDGVSRRQDPEELRDLARELQSYPKVTFPDRMLCLEILRELKDPAFISTLTQMEKAAPSNPGELATLFLWMNRNQMGLLAIDFAKGLSPDELRRWPIPFMLADADAGLADWPALEGLTKTANWGNFEFLRHVCLARAMRGEGKQVAAQNEWAIALKQGSANGDSLSSLAQTVTEWGWDAEINETLWALTRFPEKKIEALHTLYQRYADAGDTTGLYRVLSRLEQADGGDPNVENNFAQVSMLLNAQPDYARDLAQKVYQENPRNAAYATTYAYALFSKGDTAGALQVMRAFDGEQLRQPAISAYYGIFLAAGGDFAKAKQFLEIGEQAKLLPEEKALLTRATQRVDSQGQKP